MEIMRWCLPAQKTGKLCSLANLKEIFQIGGEGRDLTPRTLYGVFLMIHSKYVVET